ncbi:beta-ketoacyl-ACP synthase III [Vagococcus xieshaowenii]|uniref:Beta-ketoacyl-[acyl-carrier-protein] synthase III n=1 Tax=Vagococcus xieshaowenii TaxID=2562451 RepID=A0AAJ5JQQ5_9ENTE|nr:beta-ketoacyl-ACP synthase III [Vagococcus xieshaowenii]QCA28329.1 ketoacyl-ACP synthase III [Vagococcus xieshaowenii]TFZ42284.1 ketoacyl-ACP synthase III [Vagococcus xieshaowenii]
MNYSRITQCAHYVPEKIIHNDELATMIETSDEWIYQRTGIRQRHVVTDENTSDLCANVAQQLLTKRGIEANQIDFILVATVTPDYQMPSTACLVQGLIGANNAFAMDITAACSGFVYALSMADKLIQSGNYQRGIVIGAETMSKVIDWTDRSTAVLFGDGAGGVLLENTETKHILAENLQSDGSRANSLTAGFTNNQSPFFKGDLLGNQYLEMDGRQIFDFALKDVSKNICHTMAQLDNQTIDYVLAHQANKRLLDAMAKKTKLPREKFLDNMEFFANTSAASIPILLSEAVEKEILTLNSKQQILLTGFGGGLTWGSLVVKL